MASLFRYSRQHAVNPSLSGPNKAALSSTTPSNPWCCTASIDEVSGSVQIQRVAGYPAENHDKITPPARQVSDRIFDLTTSNDWMEHLELIGHRKTIEGGAGAYDTMRCDLVNGTNVNSWGEDFHLERLVASYGSLREKILESCGDSERMSPTQLQSSIDVAMKRSKNIIQKLLAEASEAESMKAALADFQQRSEENDKELDVIFQLIKLTVLWTPPLSESDDAEILVRGHACSSCQPVYIHAPPRPIVTTLALPVHHLTADHKVEEEVLPNRMQSPQIKVASWCRLRRKLEDPHTYKPPGIGEVLMVRRLNSQMEILEGLTSNFFAIYKDGTIRTAHDGVLYGYVRHLVLECAKNCGLQVSKDPILLQDAKEGKWESTFITSSSRLIYPIQRILVPHEELDEKTVDGNEDEDMIFEEFWTDPTFESGEETKEARWQLLLNELLIKGGYSPIK